MQDEDINRMKMLFFTKSDSCMTRASRSKSRRVDSIKHETSKPIRQSTLKSSKPSSSYSQNIDTLTCETGGTNETTSGVVSPPQSPPAARLRRLGVRQAEDHYSTDTDLLESQAKTVQDDKDTTIPLPVKRSRVRDRYLLARSASEENLQKLLKSFMDKESSQMSAFQSPTTTVSKSKNAATSLNPLGRTKVLDCPVCHKVFLSFHGHDLHLEKHEGTAIKCWLCNLRFSSNKSLIQHTRLRHNRKRQAEEMAGRGFHNLIFVDFSCDKFPIISQRYCEKNSVQAACHIHDYSCSMCSKSFPSQRSLQLHTSRYHYYPSKYICTHCNQDYRSKASLDKHKHKYSESFTKKIYLTDSKRKYLRALSLMPLCASDSFNSQLTESSEVNMAYYLKLREVETATQLLYKVHSDPEQDEDSDSTNS